MKLGTAQVIRANSRHLPLADNSVDLVVTSPPYFALRSYQDGGEHYAGQIGEEPTPAAFVASLLEVTAECVRVLKPSGSLWVNLGDKYASGDYRGGPVDQDRAEYRKAVRPPRRRAPGVPTKSLIGIPWRFALACIDDLGLILRAEVIWSKPNGLPESVTDRVRRSHEQWFHFTLSPRYFSAVDEIREAHTDSNASRKRAVDDWKASGAAGGERADYEYAPRLDGGGYVRGVPGVGTTLRPGALGKLPGSVWTIPTEPLKVPDHLGIDHFAAFPTEWPKRIIQGWSPAGVCVACGEGRRPVSVGERVATRPSGVARIGTDMDAVSGVHRVRSDAGNVRTDRTITGYACACPAPTADTTPAVILDPFGGTGTTALVAKALGRDGITVDMSADYCRLAEWRTNDRDQLANVLGVAKVEQQPAEQMSIFDTEETA